MWVTQTPNHHNCQRRTWLLLKRYEKRIQCFFGRIILVKCVLHVALKFSRVDHNVKQLHNRSDPVHTKKQSSIWFTKTILSIDVVWTPISISCLERYVTDLSACCEDVVKMTNRE